MKILLINPDCPDTFWSFKHALKFINSKAILPPLGLLTVAAMLPEHWEKKLTDMAVEPLNDRDIEWADYIFISSMHIQKQYTDEVIDKCKSMGKKIVAGGPLFTAVPHDYGHVDHLILREAEITFPPFIEDLNNGCAKHLYDTKDFAEMKHTPAPLWKLADIKKYASLSMQYSRGCPFSCDFCNITELFGRKIRTKSADQIIGELNDLYATGFRKSVFVVDDNFIANRKHLKKEILPAMIEWMEDRKYPFVLNTQVSIDIADDDELMTLMAKAGFITVFIGIETPDEMALANCSKSQNRNRDLVECVKKIQRFGLEVQAGFIIGFDTDKPSTFDTMIRFIQKSGIVTAMVGLLNAPRGTKLYERMIAEDRLLRDGTGDNTDLSINFIPKMDREELIEGYKDVIHTIYSPKQYYQRTKTLLRNLTPVKNKKKFRFDSSEIKAAFKALWFLGITGSARIYYWKLMFWSLFRRPKLMHLSIQLAINGFHFRKMFANG